MESPLQHTPGPNKKLKISEAGFRNVAQTATDSIIISNKNSIILFCNKKACETFGYSEEEMTGKNLTMIMPEKYRVRHEMGIKRFISTGSPKLIGHTVEIEGIKKNREIFPLELSLSFWWEEDEIFFTGIIRDITERKEAEEKIRHINFELEEKVKIRTLELSNKNKELIKINSDLDSFIYTASHDLKAPISNIEGLVNLLIESLGENCLKKDENETTIELISKSIVKFRNTINELANISRIQKNIDEDISEINVIDLIEDVQLSISEEIESSGANIHIDVSQCPVIKFSSTHLKSIIYNLLSNAIKYRDPARIPEIWINTEKVKDYTMLVVKDNGLGIPADKKDKVFEMFRRLHNHVKGTGIGLYIIKRIVDNNEGKIEVETEVGKGSTFKIFLKS